MSNMRGDAAKGKGLSGVKIRLAGASNLMHWRAKHVLMAGITWHFTEKYRRIEDSVKTKIILQFLTW